jgi:hypothetical protein
MGLAVSAAIADALRGVLPASGHFKTAPTTTRP